MDKSVVSGDPARERARPTIVCLCGSTRFWQAFRAEGLRETLAGRIVLSIGIHAPDSEIFAHARDAAGKATKAQLDVLHKHKIDLADEIYVLNVGGYIGDSTKSEIAYGLRRGKPLRWLEPDRADDCLIAVMQAHPAWEPMPPLPGVWPVVAAALTSPAGGERERAVNRLVMAAVNFESGGAWGKWKAWLVNGPRTKVDGIEAARAITEMQVMLDDALAAIQGLTPPASAPAKELGEAIRFAERVGPLPRCEHGSALRDGAGEALEPLCGCRPSSSAGGGALRQAWGGFVAAMRFTAFDELKWLQQNHPHDHRVHAAKTLTDLIFAPQPPRETGEAGPRGKRLKRSRTTSRTQNRRRLA